MAKKRSKTNYKPPMVWRIFHFIQRFEMDEYRRQGGLDWIRMFVTATTHGRSNESTNFMHQLEELEYYYPNQRDAYEGLYWRLGRLTATQEDWLRGYLLDADQRPLSITEIAAILHRRVPMIKQALAALKRVGMIEYVLCPEFKKPEHSKKEDEEKDRDKDKSGPKRKKKPKKKTVRKHSKTFRNVSESFKKSNSKKKSNKIGIVNRKVKVKEILRLSSSDKEKQDQTSTTPTSAPPISPTVSDEGDSAKVIPFAGSPGSVDQADTDALADGIRRVKARLNPQAQDAALEIYRELGGRWPPDTSRETAQDLGAMRNAFVRVFESGLPPSVASELWDSLIAEAKRLRKIYRANGGYQLAKCTWFNPILKDKLDTRLKAM